MWVNRLLLLLAFVAFVAGVAYSVVDVLAIYRHSSAPGGAEFMKWPVRFFIAGVIALIIHRCRMYLLTLDIESEGVESTAWVMKSMHVSAQSDYPDRHWYFLKIKITPTDAPPFVTTIHQLFKPEAENFLVAGNQLQVRYDRRTRKAIVLGDFAYPRLK